MTLSHRPNRLSFLPIVFALSSTLLSYVLIFQVPDAISKTYLFYSLMFGMILGVCFYFLFIRNKVLSQVKIKNTFYLYTLLVTILASLVLKNPDNFLLAPRTCIEVGVPAAGADGQPIKVRNINSGLQVIGYQSFTLFSLSQVEENGIWIYPGGNLSWCGRTWEKIQIDFMDVSNGSIYYLKTNNISDTFQFESVDANGLTSAFVEVPGFIFFDLLSRLSILVSVFIFIFCIALGFYSLKPRFQTSREKVYLFVCLLFLLYCVLSIYLPINPKQSIPNHDAGIFLYIGKSILQGEVVYRDLWDHKGPVIYFLNALGLGLGMGTWGVWLIEGIFIFLALLIILDIFYSRHLAVGILSVFIFSTLLNRVIEGGNVVEEYSMFFYLLAMYLFLKVDNGQTKKEKLYLVLIGCLFCLTFLLRATLISMFLAIVVIVIAKSVFTHQFKKGWDTLLPIAAGFVLTMGIFSIYFLLNSAFNEFISAAFVFNFSYQGRQFTNLIDQIGWGFKILQVSPFLILLSAAVIISGEIVRRKKQGNPSNLAALILVGFMIELVLFNISGRGYPHYSLVLIPYIALMIGLSLVYVVDFLKERLGEKILDIHMEQALSISFLVLIVPYLFLHLQKSYSALPSPDRSILAELSSTIPANTPMLIWGSHTVYNYLLDIPAGSKYINIVGLIECGYVTSERVEGFIEQLKETRPWLIYPQTPYAPLDPLDAIERKQLPLCAELSPFFNYFDIHYKKGESLSNGWVVYQPVD